MEVLAWWPAREENEIFGSYHFGLFMGYVMYSIHMGQKFGGLKSRLSLLKVWAAPVSTSRLDKS